MAKGQPIMINLANTAATLEELTDADLPGGAVSTWRDTTWADDGTGELQAPYPVVNLVHPQSKKHPDAHRHGGEFYHADREMFEDVAEFVLLRRQMTRALFDAGGDAPICSSADGIAPKPGGKVWQTPGFETNSKVRIPVPEVLRGRGVSECRGCPFAGHEDEDGAFVSGQCKASIVYLAMRADATAAILRLTWTQAGPLERWIRRMPRAQNRPLFAYRVRLKGRRIAPEGGGNAFWVVDVVEHDALTYDEAMVYNGLLAGELERFEQSMAIVTREDGRAVDTRSGEVLE